MSRSNQTHVSVKLADLIAKAKTFPMRPTLAPEGMILREGQDLFIRTEKKWVFVARICDQGV